jgi:ADP-ribose pyrophosphatase YjhB (NUDIX family)
MIIKNVDRKLIPQNLYRKIIKLIPICCVDALVIYDNKFLLTKRINSPFKNHWWFPGGRLFFMESPEAGIKRKLKEELGIKKIKKIKLLGVGENKYYKRGYFNSPSHTINIVFLTEISEREAKKIRLDFQHSNYRWFEKIPKSAHTYIRKSLKLEDFNQN